MESTLETVISDILASGGKSRATVSYLSIVNYIWSVFSHRTLVADHYIIGTDKRRTRAVWLLWHKYNHDIARPFVHS
jgi:hypothetical protein